MLQGSFVAIITPFDEIGQVDYLAFRNLVSWHLQQNTNGIVVCGTTGESPSLSLDEQQRLLQIAIDEAKGKIPIIMGTGTNDTKSSVERTELAKKAGADGCLVVVPYYNKPTFNGCLAHFSCIARVGLPVILYHHPGRTGIKFTAQQLASLCNINGIEALKESSGDLDLLGEFISICRKPVFSGDDTLTLPMIALGAKGSISVAANAIPDAWSEFVGLCLQGKFSKARLLFEHLIPFCKSLFIDTNPQGIKHAMSYLGKCRPFLRLPLIETNFEIQFQIEGSLSKILSQKGKSY